MGSTRICSPRIAAACAARRSQRGAKQHSRLRPAAALLGARPAQRRQRGGSVEGPSGARRLRTMPAGAHASTALCAVGVVGGARRRRRACKRPSTWAVRAGGRRASPERSGARAYLPAAISAAMRSAFSATSLMSPFCRAEQGRQGARGERVLLTRGKEKGRTEHPHAVKAGSRQPCFCTQALKPSASHHVEGHLRQVVVLALQHALEVVDGVLELHVLACSTTWWRGAVPCTRSGFGFGLGQPSDAPAPTPQQCAGMRCSSARCARDDVPRGAPGVPVNTSATVKGCDRKRWILRARATVILSCSMVQSSTGVDDGEPRRRAAAAARHQQAHRIPPAAPPLPRAGRRRRDTASHAPPRTARPCPGWQ